MMMKFAVLLFASTPVTCQNSGGPSPSSGGPGPVGEMTAYEKWSQDDQCTNACMTTMLASTLTNMSNPSYAEGQCATDQMTFATCMGNCVTNIKDPATKSEVVADLNQNKAKLMEDCKNPTGPMSCKGVNCEEMFALMAPSSSGQIPLLQILIFMLTFVA